MTKKSQKFRIFWTFNPFLDIYPQKSIQILHFSFKLKPLTLRGEKVLEKGGGGHFFRIPHSLTEV